MVLASLADRGFALQVRLSGDDERSSCRAARRVVSEDMNQNGGLLPLLTGPARDEELLCVLADTDIADDAARLLIWCL
jgi:hypothetical protein